MSGGCRQYCDQRMNPIEYRASLWSAKSVGRYEQERADCRSIVVSDSQHIWQTLVRLHRRLCWIYISVVGHYFIDVLRLIWHPLSWSQVIRIKRKCYTSPKWSRCVGKDIGWVPFQPLRSWRGSSTKIPRMIDATADKWKQMDDEMFKSERQKNGIIKSLF